MDDEDRRGPGIKISLKTWIAIRTAYIVKGWSYGKCATEFNVDATTIKKRGSKERWREERHQNTTEGGKAVASEMRRATEDALQKHVSLADRLVDLVISGIEEVGDMKPGRSKAETTKVYVEAADKAARLSRLVRGMRDGEASADSGEDDAITIEQRRLEPTVVPVDATGRAVSG